MLVQLTIGFAIAGIVFIVFGFFSDYLRSLKPWSEEFANMKGTNEITPGGTEDVSVLSPGYAMSPTHEKLVESAALPAMSTGVAEANWGKLNSEMCYRADIGESLKKTGNYLQRTNNYKREHPDSCSAPSHEFIGTFYTPVDGVGRKPASGTNYPPSTQGCTRDG